MAHRWRLDEPASTRHLRTAAVLRRSLETGYTMVRDAAGLDAGFKRAIDQGLIPGPRLLVTIRLVGHGRRFLEPLDRSSSVARRAH